MQVEQGRGILYWKIKNPGRMQKQVKGKQKRLGGEKRKRVGTLAFFLSSKDPSNDNVNRGSIYCYRRLLTSKKILILILPEPRDTQS